MRGRSEKRCNFPNITIYTIYTYTKLFVEFAEMSILYAYFVLVLEVPKKIFSFFFFYLLVDLEFNRNASIDINLFCGNIY